MSGGCRLDANLYRRCLSHLAEVRNLDFVVANSLPIPYFGDLAAYLASPRRVVTAALNPSNLEFPDDKPRFDVANGLDGPAALEAELSVYFRRHPYRSWFNSFEPVLNGLEASYGGKMANGVYASTALHVDMCSPIATSPTWSKLTAVQRAKLTTVGRDIFECLIDELDPDIIVASLGWWHLETWNADFEAGRRWERLAEHRTASKGKLLRTPLLVQVGSISSRKGRPLLFVNASAADKPFGRFTTERKREAGQKLLARLRGAQ
jgi:hypothetical protein